MKSNFKSKDAYITIGELAKKLNLIDKKTGNLQTHTIRYWETQFKQIKPSIRAGKRRYYSVKHYEVIKKIKFLLKEKGFTIGGVKKLLNNVNIDSVDDIATLGVNKSVFNDSSTIKNRLKNIHRITKELKEYK